MDLLRHLAFTLAGAGRHAEAAWHAARAEELNSELTSCQGTQLG
jgi:hypothetical protein